MNNGFPGPNPTETVTGGKTLELTKYDKIRRPHKLIIDDTKIKITSRTLSAELCCPICLDLLTCTMTSECLHRFCSECITTALMRGNKECPTCRKKIISKRSLRPDPNFDFLISKIWPDRKQYDVECNASMQLFQKQSNVLSLQRSIQEGIRAQAAYRKQRVQGSYDYEKRRRRPKTTVVNSDCQQQCEELSTRSIEHLTVSLTPAVYLDHEIDERCSESPMEYSCDDSGSSSDTADSSSLTSDSSISSTSSTSTNKASIQKPFSIVEDGNQYEENIENNLEHMAEEMRRRGDELEIELAPSNAFINRGMVLPSLSTSHYIRISSEITIAVLIEFLLQLANQTSDCPLHKQLMDANSSNHTTISLHSDIKLFFIDRYHRLCIIDPSEYLATIFFNSINWDRHLTIFYDINSPNDSNFELNFVIGDELAKNIERYVKAESHNINAKTEVNCESSEASAKTINSEVSHEEQVQSNIDCKPKESKFELED